jgi:hypothetical protein
MAPTVEPLAINAATKLMMKVGQNVVVPAGVMALHVITEEPAVSAVIHLTCGQVLSHLRSFMHVVPV